MKFGFSIISQAANMKGEEKIQLLQELIVAKNIILLPVEKEWAQQELEKALLPAINTKINASKSSTALRL